MFVTQKQTGMGADSWPMLIDKEKNLIIKPIEVPGYPDGESLYKFKLLINNSQIVFAGSKSEKAEENREFHVSWVMRKVTIPEEANISQDELKDIVSEALEVWSRGYNDDRPKSFRIRFTEYEIYNYGPFGSVSYWD